MFWQNNRKSEFLASLGLCILHWSAVFADNCWICSLICHVMFVYIVSFKPPHQSELRAKSSEKPYSNLSPKLFATLSNLQKWFLDSLVILRCTFLACEHRHDGLCYVSHNNKPTLLARCRQTWPIFFQQHSPFTPHHQWPTKKQPNELAFTHYCICTHAFPLARVCL